MKIKNDDALSFLQSFGFHMEENTACGFIRYNKSIGNLIVTVANGQFENKIRISMLQDKNGCIRTGYKEILEFTEMVISMQEAGLLSDSSVTMPIEDTSINELDNPLIAFPKKPEGFMMQ